MFSFKHISIRYQVIIWIALVVALSVLATGWVIQIRVKESLEKEMAHSLEHNAKAVQGMIKTSLTLSIRSHLRGIAEENVAILEKLYQDSQAGKLDKDEAWEMAEGILLSQTIGRTGYIYGITSKGILAVHPNEGMKNRDMSDHWLSKTQVAEKEGFLEYKWKNPGEEKEREKALYMAYFQPWDLIVSVSSYKNEFFSLFDLEGLRSSVLAFDSENAGSLFILDSHGDFLVRSNDSDQGQFSSLNETWQEIFSRMQEKKNGELRLGVGDKGSSTRNMLVFYNYIPDLNWYVGSYVFMDEIQAYLNQVRALIMATTGVILLMILPLSFYLGRVLTRPVSRLARDMNEAGEENFDIRADESGFGEVRELACHFNAYMEKLKEANLKLREEIENRIYAEDQLLLFAEVFKNALEGISITDSKGHIIAVNQAFTDITGYTSDEVMGKNPRILKSDRHDPPFYKAMWQQISSEGNWAGEIWNRRKNGEAYPEILSISAIRDKNNKITHYVAVFHDISEMKSQQEAIKHQAFHDALTGLPNRYLAQDRLAMAIRHARRQKERVAVIFLDMDNFKYVNDSLGHACGDILLQLFGQRLKSLVRDQDTVARLGGDEFLVIALDIQSDQEIIELSERLLQGMEPPFPVEGHELAVTFSLGVTSFPEDGKDAQTLIKNADVAMYQSKARGKNKFSLFTPELRAAAASRMEMIKDFRQALKQKEFKVFYQPKIDPDKGCVTGVEALVRWEKEDKTLVSPADFIPLAEETGMILPLGQLVMETACDRIKELNHSLPEPVTLAVNLSPIQFEQDNIVGEVLDILERSGLSPDLLELEITETTMMTNVDATVKRFDIFKNEGLSIAIDDFGTGYSSLYYLKTFPIATLKIDRSFIRDMVQEQADAKIVETIVLMAQNLDINVVAEGVETREQVDLLRSFGCDLIQGFFYARPMPFDDLLSYCIEMNGKSK